jgi:dTDP-glucose 4,6-dehydratase
VDRSILDASAFVQTNVMGTQVLLDLARAHGVNRFVQVSTDEVYGSLDPDDPPFTEDTPIQPSSPYSASKAGSDHLALAAAHTHGLDVVVTRCSNNYGPYQFPEKFIPLFVTRAMAGEALPLYGDGLNVRDWIHVQDHCTGVWAAAIHGQRGEVYNFGCDNEWSNIDVAREICRILGRPESLIQLVKDRPGHDRRYAMGFAKAKAELGWSPQYTFDRGLEDTIGWYQAHAAWLEDVQSGAYREYVETQYGASL